jgi:hypothetical protein
MRTEGHQERRRPAAIWACAGVLAAAGIGAGLWPSGVGAMVMLPVVATASAQAVRATYSVPDYVAVTNLFDGGGPVSEATGDSTGRAVTFGSLPYPGETAVFFPGVLANTTGIQPPTGYPFYARADYPTTPKAEVADPTGSYVLRAEANLGKANGLATAQFIGEGPHAVSRSAAETDVTIDDGNNVTVVAESASWGLSLGGGALTIASVRSRSTSVYKQRTDRPEVTRELVVDGARAFKQSVTIGPDGVHANDQSAAAPVGDGTKSLNEALKQAGISVRTVSGDGPGSADVLEITSEHPVPVPGNPQGSFVYRLGAVTTAISLGSDRDVSASNSDAASSPADSMFDRAAAGSVPESTSSAAAFAPAAAGVAVDNSAQRSGVAGPAVGAGEENLTGRFPETASPAGASAPMPSAGQSAPGAEPPPAVLVTPTRTFRVGGRLQLVYVLVGVSAVLLSLAPCAWRLTRAKGTGR